ncbi:hypothetical protein [Thioalkalivibrio sp. ALJ16]|uniref:hypothetical protein n=1 Tax=Thioalkalivibrio sp. ALJ16 TaxID=1158762 RepID=UPI0004764789|nr:hypothetical protein [Thioalkalivibrio sp. ALJ16]
MKKTRPSSARPGLASCTRSHRLCASTIGAATLGWLLLMGLIAPAEADEPPEILTILSQFVAVGTAAMRCTEVEEDQMIAFLANQQMVYLRSVMALEDQHPEATQEQIAATLLRGQEDIQAQVKQRIDQHGCDDPNARALVDLFAMQAEWTPGGSPRSDTE